ncbi:aldo/keto reductase [Streptomyces sp. NPDC056672]|uniref:aldo/keto reductase n=1 Tax=Streptomyces sp. NPDC056672 TaxID=3345906 RepID=UPI00368D1251
MSIADLAPRHLGRGLWVHPLGVNCAAIGAAADVRDAGRGEQSLDDGHFLEGLRRAVERGATLLDTADSYGQGHSERLIGRFLREYPNESLHLSSKVGRLRGSAPHPYAGRHIHHQLQQTLENLYAEELALYFLDSFDFGPEDRYLGTAIEQMHALRQIGAIQAIGMRGPHASYGATLTERVTRAERFLYLFRLIKPDVIWTRFNALTPAISLGGEDLFSFTARHGVGVVLAAPLAHGLLTGKAVSAAMSTLRTEDACADAVAFSPRSLDAIASGLQLLRDRFGSAPGGLTRLALRSCLQRADHCVVVAGFTSEWQVEENYTCLGEALSDTELSFIDEIYDGVRAGVEDTAARLPVQGARV